MPLEDHLRKTIEKSKIHKSDKSDLRKLMASHLTAGQKLAHMGMLREAIAEYEKEHTRPIKSSADAMIVQESYDLKGRAYRNLGDNENAIIAFQKARDLLEQYRVGSWPQLDLAEIYIEHGRFDEAIEMCQEVLARGSEWNAKQLLAKALALKADHAAQE
ncbi:MAG: tetratricopeptide repeat protein [Thermoflexales bacterium]|nr:tetratricopeptide repeat protein [Thermoflexales bacterium]